SNTFPVAFFSVYPHAIVVMTEITKKNKNNKIRGVLSGQNSFLIFIGVYRQHYYEENKIIRKTEISCKADNRQPCSIITAGSFRLITEDR
ncbi:hypothetical protein KEQ95_27510, partial [Escherichia coli]|nr:hypothetical protein [Escherichia coli]